MARNAAIHIAGSWNKRYREFRAEKEQIDRKLAFQYELE